ncbi:threonine ammonia-lyase IlvA [Niabella soli]|uniref:L-threonine dehydratase n=1 Tax=Niabella soli DSM 19437 TaxID=929713 RepID=W0F137_9BACT|nr:threonine ammonia-lyase IlvA [Niabella soli]AHF16760.1 threonine dehydratase [Niabella soli DSM 19437]
MSIEFEKAAERLKGIVIHTPLQYNQNLSKQYNCKVYLKREDLQIVRSYKLRGAYNLISSLPKTRAQQGVVCASAGNHAQGFAYSCQQLNIKGVVFMPITTPNQKVEQTNMFGGDHITIQLVGDTYDDCAAAAIAYCNQHQMTFIHPFDDEKIIEGQGTVGREITEALKDIDYVIIPIGGGGLCAGVGSYLKSVSPKTKIIGAEPLGAPSMTEALKTGHPVALSSIDRFVDGAAVKRVGDLTFSICKSILDDVLLVPEGKICTTILQLYNKDAIVAEPAGALSIAGLDLLKEQIKGKNVVCIVSGSNNDIDRMQEIKERSLQYEGLKHYFLINFAQRPGALKEFVNNILGPDDDITRFEYMQKTNKESGPALIGIELKNREDYEPFIGRLTKSQIEFTELNKDNTLFSYLV